MKKIVVLLAAILFGVTCGALQAAPTDQVPSDHYFSTQSFSMAPQACETVAAANGRILLADSGECEALCEKTRDACVSECDSRPRGPDKKMCKGDCFSTFKNCKQACRK